MNRVSARWKQPPRVGWGERWADAVALENPRGSPPRSRRSAARRNLLRWAVAFAATSDGVKPAALGVLLRVLDGSPRLGLYDANEKTRAELRVFEDHSPGLSLFDANGKPRARLVLLPDGRAGLGLYDANGVSFCTTPIKRTP